MVVAPLRVLVTGCAGFIGSQLAERLLSQGHSVVGVDAFRDTYDQVFKERNVASLKAIPDFQFKKMELDRDDLTELLDGVQAIFHTAGQAGVRGSWGSQFETYLRDNTLATQRLLEGCVEHPALKRFIFSSSSSVYGNSQSLPVTEQALPGPISPYGVTKLAAEHLCTLYAETSGVPTVSLRYFTVYGPRQRPDMAFHLLCKALLRGTPFHVLGDGEQTRDFTFVTDIVQANLLALESDEPGGVYNIAGGSRVSLNEVIETLESIAGEKAVIVRQERARGDARHTWADTSHAESGLGYKPTVGLREGLAAELEWMASLDGLEE